MKKLLTLCAFLWQSAYGQQFITKQYQFWVDSNVTYATDTNYLGYAEVLKMDIYKPIGDNNTRRPIFVYIHGGSWLGGTPNDYYPSQVSQEFVKRGYVVANIQYRMGMHTNPNITPGINCPLIAGDARCAYVSDTAEVLRASFRAIQDAKSAIRFMKSRYAIDSTCADALFVCGESAGAFTALGVTFLDKESERLNECGAIANAPAPNSTLSFCQNLFNHLPAGQQPHYERPDLGSVNGRTNLNGYSTTVKGVAAFYGAIFSEGLAKNWINGPDTPFVYMFHQGNDFVVSCGTASPIMPMNQCIPYINLGINDCVGFSNVPLAYGSCSINNYFQAIGFHKYKFEFINNYVGNPLVDCINTSQAGQGHNLDYVGVRCDSVAKQFAPIAIATMNACNNESASTATKAQLFVYPNPFIDNLIISTPDGSAITTLSIKNIMGQQIDFKAEKPFHQIRLDRNLPSGFYFLEAHTNSSQFVSKLIKH